MDSKGLTALLFLLVMVALAVYAPEQSGRLLLVAGVILALVLAADAGMHEEEQPPEDPAPGPIRKRRGSVAYAPGRKDSISRRYDDALWDLAELRAEELEAQVKQRKTGG